MLEQVDWLALVTTLPARNTAARMRLWRALKAQGAATLRDGVYLLPVRDACSAALLALADEVRAAGGSAEVLHVAASGAQDDAFRTMFFRGAEYGALIDDAAAAGDERALRRLAREFEALASIDYFPGEEQSQAGQAIERLAARLAPQEPHASGQAVRRLASADFSGRTWATRRRPWVDRLGSAWLIRRFIDRKARFLWLADPRDCPPQALGFDFDGAAFSHVKGALERVTYEVLAASFGLDADPAVARIGTIVHCLDVGGAPVAEAAGVEAVLAGLRNAIADDDKLLAAARRIFDSLYDNYKQETPQ